MKAVSDLEIAESRAAAYSGGRDPGAGESWLARRSATLGGRRGHAWGWWDWLRGLITVLAVLVGLGVLVALWYSIAFFTSKGILAAR